MQHSQANLERLQFFRLAVHICWETDEPQAIAVTQQTPVTTNQIVVRETDEPQTAAVTRQTPVITNQTCSRN